VAVFLWKHLIKEYLDVSMSPQNYTNIKDGVENQQILNIVASLGVLDTPRLVCSTTLFDALSTDTKGSYSI
jgi:hypothetical protein